MLPIPATRISDVIHTSLPLHSTDLEVAARVRYGADPEVSGPDHQDRSDAHSDPTDYFHVVLLSMSGSTSSGAKYR